MKTKIIYISGNEVFDVADIRAAFDTVRGALGLDNDTVLFGVPVDADDAFATNTNANVANITPKITVSDANNDIDETPAETITPVINDITPEQINDEPDSTEIEKPKKASRRRAKVVPIAPVADETEPMVNDAEAPVASDDTTIPILSVLGAKPTNDVDATPNLDEPLDTTTPITVIPVEPDSTGNTQIDSAHTIDDTQTVSINDMLADDSAPVAASEKTLEELLESMTPLGEDEHPISATDVVAPVPEIDTPVEPSTQPAQPGTDDTDATLELLANEFAASADEITTTTKPETRGKIGKLKNILPFKKAKRDDSGIMGDLFGWAGVANDEDFTIPGFFANASSKK